MAEMVDTSVSEAVALAGTGFPALLVEDFGDVLFHADRSDLETVAAKTLAVQSVRTTTGLPIGVNVLRNDALGAVRGAVSSG